MTARDSEKGAVGCDEASLRIVNDVCQEWKEIVEEYCMTRGVIKEKGSLKPSVLFSFQNALDSIFAQSHWLRKYLIRIFQNRTSKPF